MLLTDNLILKQIKQFYQMEQQPILNFLNLCLNNQQQINSLLELSDGILLLKVFSLINQTQISPENIKNDPQTWQMKLANLKYLYLKIKEFLQVHHIQWEDNINLLEIAKHQSYSEIVNLFEGLLEAMMNSQNKNQFIDKITQLKIEEQEFFSYKIMKFMNPQASTSPTIQAKESEDKVLLLKFAQLQEDIFSYKQANQLLKKQNTDLKIELQNYKTEGKRYIQTIKQLQRQNLAIKQQEQEHLNNDLISSKTLVISLQNKLIEENTEYEKKCLRLQEQINLLRNTVHKGQRMETLLDDAQIRIRDLSQKIFNLKEENDFLIEKGSQQQSIIKTLQQKIRGLNQDIVKMQVQKITLKADHAKSTARSDELKKMLSVSFERRMSSQRVSTQTLQSLDDPFQTKYQQVKEELNIAHRRIKQLEKDMAKSNLKLQKLQKIQQEKKKLQIVLIDFTNSRGQQVDLLTSALYEIRIKYLDLCRKQHLEDSTINSIKSIET